MLGFGKRVAVAALRAVFIKGVVGAKVSIDGGAAVSAALSIVVASVATCAGVTLLRVRLLLVPPNVNPLVPRANPCMPESASPNCAVPAIAGKVLSPQ